MDFDVFLSHNAPRQAASSSGSPSSSGARASGRCSTSGTLTPGGRWQAELADGLELSQPARSSSGPTSSATGSSRSSTLALVGRPIEREAFASSRSCCPASKIHSMPTALPPFLSTRTWVDLRAGTRRPGRASDARQRRQGRPAGPGDTRRCRCRGRRALPRAGGVRRGATRRSSSAASARSSACSSAQAHAASCASLGPSGSGKSSLVRAGPRPGLRNGRLARAATTGRSLVCDRGPIRSRRSRRALAALGGEPGDAGRRSTTSPPTSATLHLAATLALERRADRRVLVVVVDQLEEVFTLCHDERERAQFFGNLLYAASAARRPDASWSLTMRADFYARCADYPELAQHVARPAVLVGPMDARRRCGRRSRSPPAASAWARAGPRGDDPRRRRGRAGCAAAARARAARGLAAAPRRHADARGLPASRAASRARWPSARRRVFGGFDAPSSRRSRAARCCA